MSTPLTNYLTTSNPTVQQFLEQIQFTPNGLVYQNILINTNQTQPVTYIGATNRERTRQTQLHELESDITKTKQEKETLEIDLKNNENTQNEIDTLKIKIAEQTTKCHQYEKQHYEHIEERKKHINQQEQLKNAQEPLLQSLNGYTQDQCSTLVQNYKDYQQLQKDLQHLAQDIERDKTRQENLQTKHQNLATKLEDIKTKRIQKQEELEDLQTDDRYQENIDMIGQFTQRKETLKNKEKDLLKTISKLDERIDTKNDTYCQKEKKQQELKDAHEETKTIIDAITIDNYTISDELNTIDTRDIYLNFKITPLDVPKIPKSSFSERLNREIRELKNIQLDDQSLVDRMSNLQKEIDASSQVATTLLENAQISLRLILFESLQKTNTDVLKNVKAFIDTMNQQNPSHLQLSADYTLTPYGEELLEISNDSDQHNRFFTDLQDHLHKYLQDPDTTPEDIIDYLLDELEPRRWYQLNLYYERDNNGEINLLTTDEVNSFSTGERVRCYYLPIFALLEIIQNQMNPEAPRVLLMDEAFSSIDDEQTALILEKIYDLCDVFIATTPNKILPIVSNSKGLTTVWLERTTVDGVTTVQAKKKLYIRGNFMITFPNGHNLTLSEYALKHFNDTHALDAGKRLRKHLNDFLMDTYQSLDLENHNIIDNFASISVWSRGIFSPDFTGVSLLSLDRQTFQDTPVVWVFENQNTATRMIRDGFLFPFIIASGQPNRAVKQLIQTLLDRNVTLLYHGDLDISGIDIASRLKKDFPAIKFPFFTTYEFTKRVQVSIPKNQKASTSYSAFDSLRQLVLSTKTAVYEENFNINEFDNYYRTEKYLKSMKRNS